MLDRGHVRGVLLMMSLFMLLIAGAHDSAADALGPPTDAERLKKTQSAGLKDAPAKAEVKAVEDQIYTLEKPYASLWGWLEDPRGENKGKHLGRATAQIAELDRAMAALTQKDPSWSRLAEYQQRVAHLKRALDAHQKHYAAADTARDEAADAATKATAAAWTAKRVVDEGPSHDLHKASVGKILFAGKPIAPAQRTPSAFVSATTPDAPLFTRAYLAESPWNALHTAGIDCGKGSESIRDFSLITVFSVNGGVESELERQPIDDASFRTKTAFAVTASGSLTAGGLYKHVEEKLAPFAWLSGVVGELVEGENKVRLEMRAFCWGSKQRGITVATGELTIKAIKATLDAVAKRGSTKLVPSVHNKTQVASLRGRITLEGHDILEMRTASEWTPVRNDRGALVHRSLEAFAVVRKRGSRACQLFAWELQELHDGRTYGPALAIGRESRRRFVCTFK